MATLDRTKLAITEYKEISLIPRGATLANLRLSVLPFVIPTTENSLSGPGSLGTGVVGARAVIVLIPCDS
jgi:hypothetical protein